MNDQIYLSLGSNLGDRIENVKNALQSLSSSDEIKVISSSSFYETEPMGVTDQPRYINAAAKIETSLTPRALLKEVKSLEKAMGRRETFRWGPRVIDIDILLFGDIVVSEKGLNIPHPAMEKRAFVMIPLSEIGSAARHPVTGRTIGEMASGLSSQGIIRKLDIRR